MKIATSQKPSILVAVVWLCLGACGAVAGAEVALKRFTGNIEGSVLILSVNRVFYGDGTKSKGAYSFVQSADQCEEQCSFVSGCTGWAYCSSPAGCGTGCRAYHTKTGPGYLSNAGGCSPVGDYYSRDYPILDDFTSRGSKYVPDPNLCTGKDAWPQHTCTLKTGIASPPTFYSGGEAEGWISGSIQMPAECSPGLKYPMTAFECSTCLKSADPAGCLFCSKDLYTNKETCGYSRSTYWGRNKAGQVADLYGRTCLACSCYSKPSDAAKRGKCYEATKSIGVYGGKGESVNWSDMLQAAAASCPPGTTGAAASSVTAAGH